LFSRNPATEAETREQRRCLPPLAGVVLRFGQRIEVLLDDGLPVGRVIFTRYRQPSKRGYPVVSINRRSLPERGRATLRLISRPTRLEGDYVALYN